MSTMSSKVMRTLLTTCKNSIILKTSSLININDDPLEKQNKLS